MLDFIIDRNKIINYLIIVVSDTIHNFINVMVFWGSLLSIFLGLRLGMQNVGHNVWNICGDIFIVIF